MLNACLLTNCIDFQNTIYQQTGKITFDFYSYYMINDLKMQKCRIHLKHIEVLRKNKINPHLQYGYQTYYFQTDKIELLINDTDEMLYFCWGKQQDYSIAIKLNTNPYLKHDIEITIQPKNPIISILLSINGYLIFPLYALLYILSYLLEIDIKFRLMFSIAFALLFILYLFCKLYKHKLLKFTTSINKPVIFNK